MDVDLNCGAGSFAKLRCRKIITYEIISGFAALFSRSPAQEIVYLGFMTDYAQLE